MDEQHKKLYMDNLVGRKQPAESTLTKGKLLEMLGTTNYTRRVADKFDLVMNNELAGVVNDDGTSPIHIDTINQTLDEICDRRARDSHDSLLPNLVNLLITALRAHSFINRRKRLTMRLSHGSNSTEKCHTHSVMRFFLHTFT
ncbi:hypothetical protein SPOG_01161 [Schizosaccharomyces cryophilus OY26]|uniref:Uncharacterized protein n=1 Tax=Schizosaccharomyces cryophilus (strain OY26 / ATCC MYA-4695 / CBS 11777 / NBRC 106824 / NRRL Y48691) TaxID=653667 RepID=S9VR43_SCHCR|nr:uncharacterized protein SPOG_01161 [Schizosaccharomyces cryophilus OY26]EPY50403.1 hypothetical protein SPOG_01161 [Schizosaccharomyces cryophilus OY26]